MLWLFRGFLFMGGMEVKMLNLCAGECFGGDRNVMTVRFLNMD